MRYSIALLAVSWLLFSCGVSNYTKPYARKSFLPADGTSFVFHTWNGKKLTQETTTQLFSLLKTNETTFHEKTKDIRVSNTGSGEIMVAKAPSHYFGFNNGSNTVSVEFFSFSAKNEIVQLVVHGPKDEKQYYISRSNELIKVMKNEKELE